MTAKKKIATKKRKPDKAELTEPSRELYQWPMAEDSTSRDRNAATVKILEFNLPDDDDDRLVIASDILSDFAARRSNMGDMMLGELCHRAVTLMMNRLHEFSPWIIPSWVSLHSHIKETEERLRMRDLMGTAKRREGVEGATGYEINRFVVYLVNGLFWDSYKPGIFMRCPWYLQRFPDLSELEEFLRGYYNNLPEITVFNRLLRRNKCSVGSRTGTALEDTADKQWSICWQAVKRAYEKVLDVMNNCGKDVGGKASTKHRNFV
jgi:hypothetical protein